MMHKFKYGIERCTHTAQWRVVEYLNTSDRKLILARFVDNAEAHRYAQDLAAIIELTDRNHD